MAEMLSINTPAYSDPSSYQLSSLPKPTVSEPTDVLIKVHASSINPIDVKLASGMLKLAFSNNFPYKIGYDCAGVVAAVGDQVTRVKVGDEIYSRLPESNRGTWSEYAKCAEYFVAPKPKSLSFGEAASIPLAAMTALQALRKYKGSLEGKTVFIPAGCGTGAYGCQLAKNVFHAGKVITTVSTSKVPKVPKLLGEDVVDQIIDYTQEDLMSAIPPRSVDFLFDTTGQSMAFLSLMVPSTGTIVSISTQPSGTQLQESSLMRHHPEKPRLPFFVRLFLNVGDAVRRARAWRWGVNYEYMFLDTNGADLELLTEHIAARRLVSVVGTRTEFRDVEAVRNACKMAYEGKGGIGKATIENVARE